MDHIYVGLAEYLSRRTGGSKDQTEIYLYALRVWGSTFITFFVLLSLAWVLDIFIPVVVSSFSAGAVRIFAGGSHNHRAFVCTAVTVLVHGSIVSIASLLLSTPDIFLRLMQVGIFVFALFSVYSLAPVDTPNKPITDPVERKNFRKGALIAIGVIGLTQIVFWWLGLTTLFLVSSLALLWQISTLYPHSFWLMRKIDSIAESLF